MRWEHDDAFCFCPLYGVGMVVGYWVGLTLILVFHRPADSANFPPAQAGLGRQWNVKIKIQTNPLTNHHPPTLVPIP